MNERFQELHNQARDFYLQDEYLDVSTKELHRLVEQKFAELIVKECVELSVNSQYANTKSEYYEGFNEALVYAGNKIRKHFGVEE